MRETSILVATAVAALLIPLAFLVLVAVAGGRRWRGREPGRRLTGVIVLLGGLALGTFLLLSDLLLAVPFLVVAAGVVRSLLRSGRRREAGWHVVGIALPWTVQSAAYVAIGGDGDAGPPDLALSAARLLGGLAVVVAGLSLATRGDATAAPNPAAPRGQPGSRAVGNVAAAILEPGSVGPFPLSAVAALVVFVAVWIVVPLAVSAVASRRTLPIDPGVASVALAALLSAVLGTEAWIRAMPPRSRRAFEALSWLGEWELATLRNHGIREVPTDRQTALRWLAANPASSTEPDVVARLRIDVLALVGRFDEARTLAERLPAATPEDRFRRVSAFDWVDWSAGGNGTLPEMEAVAGEIIPADGDPRLRAEVSIAVARARRRLADGRTAPRDAIDPLLEVRERLGRLADGQVGRALRRRLLIRIVAVEAAVGALLLVLGQV